MSVRAPNSICKLTRCRALHLTFLLASCRPGPQIWTSPAYQPQALHTILLVPLATSSELGDQRTGVILSNPTRWTASTRACTYLASSWHDGSILCLDIPNIVDNPTLSRVEYSFALDQPITGDTWHALQASTGADAALLFRPEGADSAQDVSHRRMYPAPFGRAASSQNDVQSCPNRTCVATKNETELEYTVSARLVDMRTGRTLRTGSYSDSASRTVPRNLGYAEAPPSETLLVRIIVKLGARMLTD
jgi:hypothetical protein